MVLGAFSKLLGSTSTPLHDAARSGNVSKFYAAMDKNSQLIDIQEKELGYTALHIAAWEGYDAIVRELLQRRADANLKDVQGRTPLHLAAKQGHVEVIRALVRYGARNDVYDHLHHSPYDYAIKKSQALADMIGLPAERAALAQPPGQRAGPSGGGPGPSAAQSPRPAAPPAPAPLDHRLFDSVPNPSLYPQVNSMPHRPAQPPAPAYGGAYASGGGGTPQGAPAPAPGWQPQPSPQPQAPYQSASPYYHQAVQQQHLQSVGGSYPAPAGYGSPYGAASNTPQSSYGPPGSAQGSYGPHGSYGAPAQAGHGRDLHGHSPLGPQASPQQSAGGEEWAPRPANTWGGEPEPGSPGQGDPHRPAGPLRSAADIALQQFARLTMGRQHPAAIDAAAAAAIAGPAAVVTPPPSAPPAEPRPHGGGGLGGVLAGIAGAIRADKGKKPKQQQAEAQQLAGAGGSGSSASAANYAGPPGRTYKYAEVAAATEYFAEANKIGQGGFGAVYRGTLDGIRVAVKVMDTGRDALQGHKEFAAEVNILTRLHHPHVLLLIGSCPDKGLLVYELMEGGSLEERLFKPRPSAPALTWQDRVRVAAEVASALLYLHSATPPIVHMDLKPANVLLDRTLRAKLGDVGLARLMGHPASVPPGTTAPSTAQDSQLVGTLAYVDPQYLRTGQFSTKSDVYGLGMVMLQMLTGLDQSNVVSVVEDARRNVLHFAYVLDKRAGTWPAAEAMAFADVALKCTEFMRENRPDLRTEVLPALLQLQQRTVLYGATPVIGDGPSGPSASLSSGGQAGALDDGPNGMAPAMFVCPITQDIMRDPVVAADGYTYEREAIVAWLSKAHTSPLTNLPLSDSSVVPNKGLKSAIREWAERSQHPILAHVPM